MQRCSLMLSELKLCDLFQHAPKNRQRFLSGCLHYSRSQNHCLFTTKVLKYTILQKLCFSCAKFLEKIVLLRGYQGRNILAKNMNNNSQRLISLLFLIGGGGPRSLAICPCDGKSPAIVMLFTIFRGLLECPHCGLTGG